MDDRMKPKGSRDPLGFELIWSKLGRNIIGNLTTITGSSENFATALLGFYWANSLVGEYEGDDRVLRVRDFFLRFEQLAAYMRKVEGSGSVMGVNRVNRRLGDDSLKKFVLGNGAEAQILSSQVSYGLWGLYSSAMRDTGLVKGEARVITDAGIKIALAIEEQLDKGVFLSLIAKENVSRSDIEKNSASLMAAISSDEVQRILLETLLQGASDERVCLQKELWSKTCQLMDRGLFSAEQPVSVALFIDSLKHEGLSPRLHKSLTDIEAVERNLVIMNNIFHFCRSKSGESISDIVTAIEKQDYDFSILDYDLAGVEFSRKESTLKPIKYLKAGNYHGAIEAIFSLNKEVMKDRGGAAWVSAPGEVLDVVVKAESTDLKTAVKVRESWDYDYFVGSYLRMAKKYAAQYISA